MIISSIPFPGVKAIRRYGPPRICRGRQTVVYLKLTGWILPGLALRLIPVDRAGTMAWLIPDRQSVYIRVAGPRLSPRL